MRVGIDEAPKGLRDGDHSGSSPLVVDSLCHQHLEGLIGETGEVGEKFSVSQEITPEHPGDSEGDEGMADVCVPTSRAVITSPAPSGRS